MTNTHTSVYVGTGASVNADGTKLTLRHDVPAQARSIRYIDAARGECILLLNNMCATVKRKQYVPDFVNECIVIVCTIQQLTILENDTPADILLSLHVNDVVPWQREKLAEYQKANMGHANV